MTKKTVSVERRTSERAIVSDQASERVTQRMSKRMERASARMRGVSARVGGPSCARGRVCGDRCVCAFFSVWRLCAVTLVRQTPQSALAGNDPKGDCTSVLDSLCVDVHPEHALFPRHDGTLYSVLRPTFSFELFLSLMTCGKRHGVRGKVRTASQGKKKSVKAVGNRTRQQEAQGWPHSITNCNHTLIVQREESVSG